MTLDELELGGSARVKVVGGEQALRHHLLDMGLIPGIVVKLVKKAPLGDPIQISLWGYELTLRIADAKFIEIAPVKLEKPEIINKHSEKSVEHPRFGENDNYATKQKGRVIPEGEKITFALVGNQNCGKTTLFNQLTGSNQHVGNFPGVTVESKVGKVKNVENAFITDLPGIYSLSPYSNEEIVTRDYLLKHRPQGIINILDAANLERNLYLTMQLIELNIPMVLALNMMDEIRKNGGTILINKLEKMLGVPVVPISASKNEGIDELMQHAVRMARGRLRPGRMDFCNNQGTDNDRAVHRCIHSIRHSIDDHARAIKIPPRFAATKLVEGDRLILEDLNLEENEKEAIEHIILQLEEEGGKDRVSSIVEMRFSFIDKVCKETLIKPTESKEHLRSAKIDRILTGKHTAIPVFVLIISLMFLMTFAVLGPILSKGLGFLLDELTIVVDRGLTAYGLNSIVHSLIIDGMFAGVGSVLSFLPIIVVLFFFLSIMEDSGYMARVAFVMDRLLRRIGLSGRSFVPMLIGFGCSVPAIMATRTLSSERDRNMTIALIPFMSCSAKLPIYVLFSSVFFPGYQGIIIVIIYLLGFVAGVLYGRIVKDTKYKGEPIPFVMELPNYRIPTLKNVGQLLWDKSKDFMTKAFTIIFYASIVVWFLQTFDLRLNVVQDSANSILALLGGLISPIFKPLGFGDWRTSTALITGLVAKESVVSTLTVLFGGSTTALASLFTPSTAFTFLIFTLYYTPCVAAIAAANREFGSIVKTLKLVLMQCTVAWGVAFIFRLIFLVLGIN